MSWLRRMVPPLAFGAVWAVSSAGQTSPPSHDFGGDRWSGTVQEMCEACHFADDGTDPASDTLAYSTGSSLRCLGCHDGSVAVERYAGPAGTAYLDGRFLIGPDLSKDHPVGFTYDPGAGFGREPRLRPLAEVQAAGLLFGPGEDRVECPSCHDVHEGDAGAKLVRDNTRSRLCLTCHDK